MAYSMNFTKISVAGVKIGAEIGPGCGRRKHEPGHSGP